jgi:hypothetical protein
MPVAYYSRKLTKSKQNTFKIHGHIFLEDNNVRFHHIKDKPNTLTDARSVSPLMRGRTPWRRLRQQHLFQIFSLFFQIFFILRSTDITTSLRGSKNPCHETNANCQAI